MTNREPLAAPVGTKWSVSRSDLTGVTFKLELWPAGTLLDETGWVVDKKGRPILRWPLTTAYFNRQWQIRQASRKCIREYKREQSEERWVARNLNEMQGL